MRRNIELQVGSLVLVAIVVASVGLLFLKEFKFRTATYPIHVSFPEASGISEGAPVLIRGVKGGQVQEIRLERERVELILGIEEGVDISVDAEFVMQPDLMSPTYITVAQGRSPEILSAGDHVDGTAHVELAAMLENSAGLLLRVDRLTRRLDDFLASGKVDTLLAELGGGARELRLLAAESRETLPGALAELEGLAAELRSFSEVLKPKLGDGLDRMGSLAAELESLSGQMREASVGFVAMGRQLEEGEGTLGRLVAEDDLYLRLESALGRVDTLIADIKADPKRYLTFELF